MIQESPSVYNNQRKHIDWLPANQFREHTPQKNKTNHLPTRVLLADDSGEMRVMVSAVLRQQGYDVTEVADGHQLVEILATNLLRKPDDEAGFDMILSDIRMPGFSGLDVLASLHMAGWHLPVILMTAFGSDETRYEADYYGASYFLKKPFRLEELIEAVYAVAPPRNT